MVRTRSSSRTREAAGARRRAAAAKTPSRNAKRAERNRSASPAKGKDRRSRSATPTRRSARVADKKAEKSGASSGPLYPDINVLWIHGMESSAHSTKANRMRESFKGTFSSYFVVIIIGSSENNQGFHSSLIAFIFAKSMTSDFMPGGEALM